MIKAIKRKYEPIWLALPEVVAVGIGKTSDGATGIIISVRSLTGTVRSSIPSAIEGIPIEIQVSGEIKAL